MQAKPKSRSKVRPQEGLMICCGLGFFIGKGIIYHKISHIEVG